MNHYHDHTMAKALTKQLGLLDVFAIASGAMISSGLFVLPGILAGRVGPAVIWLYLFSGLLLLPSMASAAELSTAMPRAGGTYFFVSRSLGTMFGTINGVGVWLVMLLKCGVALIGLGAYLATYVNLPMRVISAGFCVVFIGMNLVGVKETARAQVVMILALAGILCLLVVRGIPALDGSRLQPMLPFGAQPILPTIALIFVSFIGLTKVASVSEEVRDPERTIPRGMLLSLVVVSLLYGLVVLVVVGVVPAAQLHGSLTPLGDAARAVMGSPGGHLIALAGIFAFATTANAAMMSATRYILAMSRDHVIPHGLSRLSRFGVPPRSVLFTGAIILVVVSTFGLESVAKLASAYQLLVFAIINISVIVMRESGIDSYDPGFRSPLYPFTQIAGIVISVVLIPAMGLLSSVLAMGLLGLGIAWHYFYVHKRVDRVGAVAKVAERVAERLLQRDAEVLGLKRELRQILKEKGLREGDPFLQTLGAADILEIEEGLTAEHVLRRGARMLAGHSSVSSDLILGGLLERSRLGETPADAGIALPHVLLDEVDGFYMVVARSISGIEFAMSDEPIHAVFLLLGDRKNPAQHLRFLAEIARRAENPDFIKQWIAAETPEDLRKLLAQIQTSE